MKRKILILIGLPASGKSTYANEWIKEDPENRIRFNRDDIRNMMGQYWLPKREPIINDIYVTFLESAMGRGYDIIIDNMNLNPEAIKEIENIVNNFNNWENNPLEYSIEKKSFTDVPLNTCIERDKNRNNPIGEKIIRSIYNKYKYIIEPWKYLN